MSEHIQPLLERIQNEGLKKAEADRDQILESAKAAADKIIADAKHAANTIRESAERDATANLLQGQTALTQAARDLLLKLRSEIARQVNVAAEKAATSALSAPELVSAILPELAKCGTGNLKIEAGSALAAQLKDLLPALLKEAGKDGEVVMNPKSGAGFQLRFTDTPEAIDFSSQAVADWLSHSLRPELADLLRPENPGA
jgi:V/A-type H+/Na+-transporting ATPase subunit E